MSDKPYTAQIHNPIRDLAVYDPVPKVWDVPAGSKTGESITLDYEKTDSRVKIHSVDVVNGSDADVTAGFFKRGENGNGAYNPDKPTKELKIAAGAIETVELENWFGSKNGATVVLSLSTDAADGGKVEVLPYEIGCR